MQLAPLAASRPQPRRDDVAACLACPSRRVGLCAGLGMEVQREIARDATRVTLAPGATIFLQGDPARHVVSLVEGAARLVRVLPDGRRCAIGFRFAGDLIGFTPADEYPFGAETLCAATICLIARRRLAELFRTFPAIEARMLDLCARELAATQDHLLLLGRFCAEERVAAFLLSLARRQDGGGRFVTHLDLPATRADLGDLLGLTLETVSRVLSAFRRRGLIALHGASRVELLDLSRLAALAQVEAAGPEN